MTASQRVLLINPTITSPRHARFPLAIMNLSASLDGKYKSTKFWIIVAAISGGSMLALPGLVSDLNASDHSDHPLFLFLLLLIAAFGITLLPFAIWQQVTKRKFFTWLE